MILNPAGAEEDETDLDDICSGDPEAEPEVLAVTMGNQTRPLAGNGLKTGRTLHLP